MNTATVCTVADRGRTNRSYAERKLNGGCLLMGGKLHLGVRMWVTLFWLAIIGMVLAFGRAVLAMRWGIPCKLSYHAWGVGTDLEIGRRSK